MAEGDPGTRRYKWFRPRQAARGGVSKNTAGAGKFATISLYNASTGPHVLVVRDWVVLQISGDGFVFGYNQGRLAGTAGVVTPMFPGDGARAGLVDYQAAAAVLPGDYQYTSSGTTLQFWVHDFPFAIVPPGWAFFMQITTAAAAISGGFVWEELSIDELEYFYF